MKISLPEMIQTLRDIETAERTEGRPRAAILAAIRRKSEWEVALAADEAERMKGYVQYHERRAVVRERH